MADEKRVRLLAARKMLASSTPLARSDSVPFGAMSARARRPKALSKSEGVKGRAQDDSARSPMKRQKSVLELKMEDARNRFMSTTDVSAPNEGDEAKVEVDSEGKSQAGKAEENETTQDSASPTDSTQASEMEEDGEDVDLSAIQHGKFQSLQFLKSLKRPEINKLKDWRRARGFARERISQGLAKQIPKSGIPVETLNLRTAQTQLLIERIYQAGHPNDDPAKIDPDEKFQYVEEIVEEYLMSLLLGMGREETSTENQSNLLKEISSGVKAIYAKPVCDFPISKDLPRLIKNISIQEGLSQDTLETICGGNDPPSKVVAIEALLLTLETTLESNKRRRDRRVRMIKKKMKRHVPSEEALLDATSLEAVFKAAFPQKKQKKKKTQRTKDKPLRVLKCLTQSILAPVITTLTTECKKEHLEFNSKPNTWVIAVRIVWSLDEITIVHRKTQVHTPASEDIFGEFEFTWEVGFVFDIFMTKLKGVSISLINSETSSKKLTKILQKLFLQLK
eukprot:TRINITY_DN8409_c0_g1_i1.p1 TRINITY_DN8409_c0_g1~~TRINITY_DN8409_c0_g1_i1.p1  ORF type:complete len:508 (+),score=95.12 TRINITY_DN8409_c0_g1_i1:41-1564(+)